MEARRDPTTILTGGGGQPPIVVRDHDGWRAQVEAAKRRQVDERIAGTLAAIRDGEADRDEAPRAGLTELAEQARVSTLLHRERMGAPGRVARQLAETQALLDGMAAAQPPQPDPAAAKRARDDDYSFGLAETMAGLRETKRAVRPGGTRTVQSWD